jgi:hypothetical protein
MTRTDCPEESLLTELAIEGLGPGPIAEHLRDCPACRKRFDERKALLTGLDLLSSAPAARPAAPDRPEGPDRPTSVGKYFILGPVQEREGMTVYRGVHSLIQNDEVFVYLADSPMPDDEGARGRFESACAPLTRFAHPAIAPAVDLGYLGGRPYLMLQYVPGHSFERVLQERTFSRAEAAAIGADLARALATAHGAGVFHGSLGPESLRFDEAGNVRIVDFGASRLIGTAGRDPTAVTDLAALGSLIGLLSPELAAIGARSASPDPAIRFRDADELARALDREARPGGLGAAASVLSRVMTRLGLRNSRPGE